MSGKVWILITAVSFITHVYHVQSKCMKQDIKAHLDEMLLEEHMFQIKVFSPETKEHELLSVINTLCSYWTNNKGKDKLKVVQTFHIMLYNLDEKFKDFCANLNCTDAYTVRGIDTATFGEMYRKSCNGSVSDLKCPSKSAPLTTISPTPEFSTAFLTTVSLITTDHESLTSLTTLVSPNITAPENLTADPSARTETIIKDDSQWATIKTCSGLLVVSFLLNTVLLFKVFHMHRKSKTSREMTHLELQGRHLISK
ncbi:uncharacterized protein LOC107729571 isoform X3 [Sinocyclocheilus rhinocerous]|uniref:uncharacterized protein LOC107729571 isoform X2 n=1 Tax=Sinocyclocheilus rhinocerous TaxID=307959 RepID=UPI0007B92EA1|nr:PREDICTED: uncharacterized protein LOC107729571 isoform X2 [Sinocyclocheilus rhinocerous]XP_016395631.1 PREDICTED: uncharacterized protein LOC107729571 isoform X3 [Sinocyclocheilus rhinocerous]